MDISSPIHTQGSYNNLFTRSSAISTFRLKGGRRRYILIWYPIRSVSWMPMLLFGGIGGTISFVPSIYQQYQQFTSVKSICMTIIIVFTRI
ncbi:hypothetical protein L208DRAFT_142537 [Tricholoma matsutake]|nr:hypothetical protein L208DRAFT_142537 [Tricholoma matsutake 945]